MWIGLVLLGLLVLAPVATWPEGDHDGKGPVHSAELYMTQEVPRGKAVPTLLLVEVLPHAPRDNEYVVVANPGRSRVNLAGWSLTDGEGSWGLPALPLGVGGGILLTRNGTALWEDAGLLAHACVVGCDGLLTVHGSLALRNQGDDLQLLDPDGRLVDAFVFGEVSNRPGWVGDPVATLAKGLVARRRADDDGWRDSDTSADWAWNRTFRLGQSHRLPAAFEDVPVRPLLSPDDSREDLLALIQSAQSRIELAGFTLTNTALAEALRDALNRGVRVQIGLEASPPGGIGIEGEQILGELQRAGARVLLMGSHGEGAWRRYALHHAKYAVVDETWVVVGSENFSSNGYPLGAGNRGWGIAVRSPPLASWFLGVLRGDWDENRSDIRPFAEGGGSHRNAVRRPALPPWPSPLAMADVTAYLGPDNAATEEGLLGLLRGAEESIDVELFYLRWWWNGRLNPLVAGLLDATERGVTVRILLDGKSYNVHEDDDNDEAVRRLNGLAAQREHALEARIFPGDSRDILKLHNKGVLIDDRGVWVSSMNWNLAGAYANREAGLFVDSREVAGVFRTAFEADWNTGDPLGPPASADAPERETFLWIGLGSGAAAGAWWWVLRTTKEATSKHPRKAGTWRRRSKQPISPSRRRRSRNTRTVRSIGGSTDRAWRPRGRRR